MDLEYLEGEGLVGRDKEAPLIEVEIDLGLLEREMAQGWWEQPLKKLWRSTLGFHARWKPEEMARLTSQDVGDRERRMAVYTAIDMLREEAAEVTEAALHEPNYNVVEEAADVMVTLIGILLTRGITYPELEEAIHFVIKKNDAKTEDTHYVDGVTGKIKRREE